jgi:hypothetical protein
VGLFTAHNVADAIESPYATQWHSSKAGVSPIAQSQATPITLKKGQISQNVNFVLNTCGSISGKITGIPSEFNKYEISVWAVPANLSFDKSFSSATTRAIPTTVKKTKASFTLTGLKPEKFHIFVNLGSFGWKGTSFFYRMYQHKKTITIKGCSTHVKNVNISNYGKISKGEVWVGVDTTSEVVKYPKKAKAFVWVQGVVARDTGKITLTVKKNKKTVATVKTTLKAKNKGVRTISLPKLSRGKYTLSVKFKPTGGTKKYSKGKVKYYGSYKFTVK